MPTKQTPVGSEPRPSQSGDQPAVVQVDDPIIVKGGSISLTFDQHNFRDLTGSAMDKNRRFDHEFQPPLQRIKVFRAGTKIHDLPLERMDRIKICYAGSECDDNPPN